MESSRPRDDELDGEGGSPPSAVELPTGQAGGEDAGGNGSPPSSAPPAGPRSQEYADPSTWDARYSNTDSTFDWYATYTELKDVMDEFSPASAAGETLMVGCGNSELSSQMHAAGYTSMVNIDISPLVVQKMEEKYSDLGMEWLAMDATAMDFPAGRFGLAVDKGTVDAMMCGEDGREAAGLCAEVWRTLRPGGIFMLVSHNGKRQHLLDESVRLVGTPGASWERLELRKNRLSSQAVFVNVLRSKLGGRPLAEAFKDPEMLKEAAAETKKSQKQMALLEAFRLFKGRKARQRAEARERAIAAGEPLPPEPPREEEEETGVFDSPDPRRQPFCWVYVLRKPLVAGTQEPNADTQELAPATQEPAGKEEPAAAKQEPAAAQEPTAATLELAAAGEMIETAPPATPPKCGHPSSPAERSLQTA